MKNAYLRDRHLVTGASGQLGRAVVRELLRLGATHIVAATRKPEDLSDLSKQGVEVRAADFEQPETLRSTFAGLDRLALISTDALAIPGKRLAQHRSAVSATLKSGVAHVIYTSAPAPHPTAESSPIDDLFWTETALFAAPFTWTILRNELYMENILTSLDQALESGKLVSATNNRGRAYVSRLDCARTIAAAMLGAEGSEVLDVTGRAVISQDELTAIISEVAGKTIKHVCVSSSVLKEGLTQAGLPRHLIKLLVDFDMDASQGYPDVVTDTVERLTDRQPLTLRELLKKHLAVDTSLSRK